MKPGVTEQYYYLIEFINNSHTDYAVVMARHSTEAEELFKDDANLELGLSDVEILSVTLLEFCLKRCHIITPKGSM